MKKMKRIAAITLSVLMLFAFMPFLPGMAEDAYAEGEMPEVTVTIDPGIIGGTPITYKNTDPGMMRTPEHYANGMFDWDGNKVWYMYPDLPASFSKPGYAFVGWTMRDNDSLKQPGYQDVVVADFTITAHWNYVVTLDSVIGPTEEIIVPEDGCFEVPTCPESWQHYMNVVIWKGVYSDGTVEWYTPGETVQLDLSKINGSLTLQAFRDNSNLSLCSYDYSNGTSGLNGGGRFTDPNGSGELSYGYIDYSLVPGRYTITAYPDNGYRFKGWYNGEYISEDEQGNSIQAAIPNMDQQITTDPTLVLSLECNRVICPVFEIPSFKSATVTGIKTKTYTGKAQTQTVTVTLAGKTLQKDTDYTVSYKNNTKAGTATMIISGIGDYEGSITKTFKINKAKNPMTVKAKTATVRYSRLKKANQTLTVSKVLAISKKQGTATYVKKGGHKKITISKKTGKVTVKKGLKKGTYRVKVAVTASGTTNYNKVTKTVTFTVKVK